jgi:hypothetical protein
MPGASRLFDAVCTACCFMLCASHVWVLCAPCCKWYFVSAETRFHVCQRVARLLQFGLCFILLVL